MGHNAFDLYLILYECERRQLRDSAPYPSPTAYSDILAFIPLDLARKQLFVDLRFLTLTGTCIYTSPRLRDRRRISPSSSSSQNLRRASLPARPPSLPSSPGYHLQFRRHLAFLLNTYSTSPLPNRITSHPTAPPHPAIAQSRPPCTYLWSLDLRRICILIDGLQSNTLPSAIIATPQNPHSLSSAPAQPNPNPLQYKSKHKFNPGQVESHQPPRSLAPQHKSTYSSESAPPPFQWTLTLARYCPSAHILVLRSDHSHPTRPSPNPPPHTPLHYRVPAPTTHGPLASSLRSAVSWPAAVPGQGHIFRQRHLPLASSSLARLASLVNDCFLLHTTSK
ncbi:hypothetical protein R3P38DRAFT_3185692 [Favolaschia claudopus]|uniref:Uncharacterized protein n=1 Tax=Favolaschia claudopus TaxID=2862362 RepID=A0AAW0C5F9_9AGAR